MNVPSPNEIYDLTDTLIDDVESLAEEYERAYLYAHDRRDTDRSGPKSHSSVRTISNQTQEIALEQQRARRVVRKAAERIETLANGTSLRIRGTQGIPEDDPRFRRGIMGHLDDTFTDPRAYEPLAGAVVQQEDETAMFKEAEAMRNKRLMLERADRYENRARTLRRLAKGVA